MSAVTDLPPKENALYKRLRRCYEWKLYKQYKNGLKFAKQILSNPKFSEHAETLATKGLLLSFMGKKEEAFELVRRGLRSNLKSHLCWHAYAILQRGDRKYDEAIKCVRNALKWDKENVLYLRDLSIFQIQTRDLQGYRETRYQLLVLRPSQKVSWIGYAMTHHLTGDYEMALNVLEEFRKTQTVTKDHDYEHSELISYQVWVMVEAGKLQEALEHLDKHAHHVVDEIFVQETRGDLYLKLGQCEKAMEVYRELLRRNPENVAYYKALQAASSDGSDSAKEEMLRESIKEFPRALSPKLLLLQLLQGDSFRKEADQFLRRTLSKGVPPTFKNLRPLYACAKKTQILQELVLGYVSSLEANNLFHPDDPEDDKEPPTSLLWSLYYLAQHYDYLHRYQDALATIDRAIQHTMTLIELYLVKAKIFKHMGNMLGAVSCLDEAQSLDTADRYVNCKCTKYMLRAGQLEQAQLMAAKFTREGTTAMESFNEMQCMWFAIETAMHYKGKKMYGEALKMCHEIDRHFSGIIEDQYEFHMYCLRKLTLRSYVELLRLEDSIRAHKFFSKTAKIAIEIYLHLHKHPLSDSNNADDENNDNLSAAEKKKLRNKQRKKEMQQQKQQQQQQQHTQQQKQQSSKQKNADADADTHKEEELVPEKLARPENALEEAMRFLRPLQVFSPGNIDTHVLAFQVAFQRGKVLLMLQAIRRGHAINASHPGMHQCIVQFVLHVSKVLDQQEPVVKELLQKEMEKLFAHKSAEELNQLFIEQHCNDNLPSLLAASRMHAYLNNDKKQEGLDMLMAKMSLNEQSTDVKDCEEVFAAMKAGDFGDCESSMEAFKSTFSQTFPHSTLLHLCNNNPDSVNNDASEAATNFSPTIMPNGTN